MPDLLVELVSPERVAYSGSARMVVARTTTGDIAFMAGHVPFIGVLQTHEVRVHLDDGSVEAFAVHQGFVEVAPGEDGTTRVTVLSDTCELRDQIDVPRAEAARDRAEKALAADPDDEIMQAALRRAQVRLNVAQVGTSAAKH
jgi:F-type H+-transporting ATPase subunit epsilon